MPKLKTHKGAAARFRQTGTGKFVRMKGHRSHIRRTKHAKVRRLFSRKIASAPVDRKKLKSVMPYGAA
ncbi:MAG: 50S ribosomal protein L35 [SAR202 cluster bacterium]|nr:50S ribosomal protein L35 [SAR202 cluster bacterium]